MKPYPEPRQNFEDFAWRQSQRYAEGLEQLGVQPGPILTKALGDRIAEEARVRFRHDMAERRAREARRKRDEARIRLWLYPAIAAMFGVASWYNFALSGHLLIALVYAAGVLIFLALLALGAVKNRPSEPEK